MNWRLLPFLLTIPFFSSLFAQNEFFNDGALVHVQGGGLIYVEGDVINDDQGANIGSIRNLGDIQLEGDWENRSAGSFVFTTNDPGTTTFLGNNAVQTIGGSNVTNFNNLTINKPGNTEVRQLINSGNDGVLDLNNDILNTQTFIFGVGNTAANAIQRTGPITPAPTYSDILTQGYVTSTPGSAGRLSRATVPGNRYFYPLGHASPARFRPVEIVPTLGTPNAYSVQFVNLATPNAANVAAPIASVNPNWYHFIERQVNGSPEEIRIYWSDPNDDACDPTTVTIGEYDGSNWQNTGAVTTASFVAPGLSHTSNTTYPGTYPGTPFNTNRFVLGDTQYNPWGGLCVLPVNLVDLRADALSTTILVSWITLTESNNRGFDLMRSENGTDFSFVKFFDGQGNSTSPSNYSYEDEEVEFNKTYYYRLEQHDFNGQSRTSETVEAMITADPTLEIGEFYPNPSNGHNYLRVIAPTATEVTLSVYNALGQDLFNASQEVHAGVNEVPFDFSELASGNYLAAISADGKIFHRRFVVK